MRLERTFRLALHVRHEAPHASRCDHWVNTRGVTRVEPAEVLDRRRSSIGRDREQKRAFHLRVGVTEFWKADRWSGMPEASDAFRIDVSAYFDEAIGAG